MNDFKISYGEPIFSPGADGFEWVKLRVIIENLTNREIHPGNLRLRVETSEDLNIKNDLHEKEPPFKVPLIGFLGDVESGSNEEEIIIMFEKEKGEIEEDFIVDLSLVKPNGESRNDRFQVPVEEELNKE